MATRHPVPRTTVSDTAGAWIAELPEIIELIFLLLDYPDLLRAQRVCRRWRACTRDIESVRKRVWKQAQEIGPGDNPHFDAPIAASRDILLPNGENFRHRLQRLHDEYLSDPEKLHEQGRSISPYRVAMGDLLNDVLQSFGDFHSWPPGLRDLWCTVCAGFHDHFQYENIHPVLHFIQNFPFCCVQGHGTNLLMTFTFWDETPEPDFYALVEQIVAFCELLEGAYDIIDDSSLQADVFTKPASTHLIVASQSGFSPTFVRSTEALTLEDVMEPIATSCRTFLLDVPHFTHASGHMLRYMMSIF